MAESESRTEGTRMISPTTSISERVTFTKIGVCANIGEEDEEALIRGSLSLVEKPYGIFIEWIPIENPEDSNEWVFTPPTAVSFNPGNQKEAVNIGASKKSPVPKSKDGVPSATINESTLLKTENLKKFHISVDIRDLSSFQCYEERPKRKSKSGTGVSKVINTKNGVFHPWIRLISKDGSNYLPLYFREDGLSDFISALQKYCTLKRSVKDSNLILFTDEKTEALQASVSVLFRDTHTDIFSRFMHNPYSTALTGLGKVTNFVQDHLVNALMDGEYMDDAVHREEVKSMIDAIQQKQDETDAADLRLHNDETGFELVTRLELPSRPSISRDDPVSEADWKSFVDAEGRVNNVRELKLLIYRGGMHPGLRSEVWKFLLGYYDWKSTTEERAELRKKRVDDYFRMKLQWKSFTDEQITRFMEFDNRKGLVEKDVARTDRNHKFFEGDNNSNVSMLFDILMTYCMYNFDLGYVQGMSDLLSPVLVVMENEVDAFWCFVGFMEKVHKNFEMTQECIRTQLMHLRDLLMVVNPRLANYLESHKSDNMYFSFRWLLVLFKREFSFEKIMRLWEVLWTELPCKNFHLLICVAILDPQVEIVIQNKFGFTEILKHVNDLSMQIDLEETLVTAESIFHQLAAIQDKLPGHICEILGFHPYAVSSSGSSPKRNGTPVEAPNHGDGPTETAPQISPGGTSTSSVEILS